MALLNQVRTLIWKDLRILVWRHPIKVAFMSFIVPLILAAVFSFAKNLFVPPAVYGFGQVRPVKTLAEAYSAGLHSGRAKVILVDRGYVGGDIERVLDRLQDQIAASNPHIKVSRSHDETVLASECRSNLRGVTACFNAVVMLSSPNEGRGGLWNYTIRTDAEMWYSPLKVRVDGSSNPEEIYLLPTQRAVDTIIAALHNPKATDVLARNEELAFTSLTQAERENKVRHIFHKAIIKFMGVAFLTNIFWISYHLPGFIASERETGMSQLIDAMMPVAKPWMSLAARIVSHHLASTLLYAPAWIISSIIVRSGVFTHTSTAIVLFLYLLGGLGTASLSVFFASFFKKAQLSGILTILAIALLGIMAQSLVNPTTAVVAILSLLFTPCAFVYFITLMSRFEKVDRPTHLIQLPPIDSSSSFQIPGIVLLAFILIHVFAYPLMAALVEKRLYGIATEGRQVRTKQADTNDLGDDAVRLESFTKIYDPSFLAALPVRGLKASTPVVAVDNLTFNVRRGQIVALLGANGSGKSTTLDAIAGLNKLSRGSITVDGTGGLGIAPQKNVLWDDLTVEEHLGIFDRLKSPHMRASRDEIIEMTRSIDLYHKRKAFAKTLSGGQKRKLQLGMMLVGGSAVCCIDEVSSGIDPLSRRKLWDILLAERGKRTLIMTTHFLDEADLLADHIAILSKGTLRAQGSSVELKDRLGGGYRVHVQKSPDRQPLPNIAGVKKELSFDTVTYVASTSILAAQVVKEVQSAGVSDYRFSGPTMENVFLQVAEEAMDEEALRTATHRRAPMKSSSVDEKIVELDSSSQEDSVKTVGLNLLNGRRVTYREQVVILLKKRWTILRRNWVLYLVAFILPIVAAGLTSLYVRGTTPVGCSPADLAPSSESQDAFTQFGDDYANKTIRFPAGPPSRINKTSLMQASMPIIADQSVGSIMLAMLNNLESVDSFDDFVNFTKNNAEDMTTGLWLGDDKSNPTIAWVANMAFTSPLTAQQFLNLALTNTSIQATWTPFDVPFTPQLGQALNLIIYMGLALVVYPAFFALYPSNERRKFVRSLQYSNGVRPLPLWVAYICFDFVIVLLCSAVVTALWAGLSDVWFHVECVFIVLFLYGLASIMVANLVSLFAKSQLATFAWAVCGQGVCFLCYLIAYMCIVTYAQASKMDAALLTCHFIISAVMPIGSAMRALFLATNLFSTACDGIRLSTHPLSITKFGGPILFLVVQSCLLFGLLLWFDSGAAGSSLRNLVNRHRPLETPTEEVNNDRADMKRVTDFDDEKGAGDGLRVVNVTKSFGKYTAVDNVSFGIRRGEVFALLGPNGAGKSTTISLIRGDIKPSLGSGDILIEDASVTRHLAAARANLGVCPQVDALDQMTVQEHLEFYARVRGIPDVQHNVEAVLQAVGLSSFSTRMAAALSGGNKRKLSLGIALMGNPAVLLLDEPSSGLDAAAKRIMWRTLEATVPGRSILLTTHSMEEADALAGRAGILARRMLALGTPDDLRHRFGDVLHVHLVSSTAPRTSAEEMGRIAAWIQRVLPAAVIEEKTYHGQLRFSVRGADVLTANKGGEHSLPTSSHGIESSHSAVGRLVILLDESRGELGVEHYSVSPTTLDQVFLAIVGDHKVQEEEQETRPGRVARLLKFGRR